MRYGITLALLGLALVGCGRSPDPGDVDPDLNPAETDRLLATDRSAYTAGSTVTLRLRNSLSHELGYNLCHSLLERSAGNEWRQVQENRVCTMELRILQPGATSTYDLRLDPGLGEGEYRFRTSIEHMGQQRTELAASNSFRVTR